MSTQSTSTAEALIPYYDGCLSVFRAEKLEFFSSTEELQAAKPFLLIHAHGNTQPAFPNPTSIDSEVQSSPLSLTIEMYWKGGLAIKLVFMIVCLSVSFTGKSVRQVTLTKNQEYASHGTHSVSLFQRGSDPNSSQISYSIVPDQSWPWLTITPLRGVLSLPPVQGVRLSSVNSMSSFINVTLNSSGLPESSKAYIAFIQARCATSLVYISVGLSCARFSFCAAHLQCMTAFLRVSLASETDQMFPAFALPLCLPCMSASFSLPPSRATFIPLHVLPFLYCVCCLANLCDIRSIITLCCIAQVEMVGRFSQFLTCKVCLHVEAQPLAERSRLGQLVPPSLLCSDVIPPRLEVAQVDMDVNFHVQLCDIDGIAIDHDPRNENGTRTLVSYMSQREKTTLLANRYIGSGGYEVHFQSSLHGLLVINVQLEGKQIGRDLQASLAFSIAML